MKKILMGMIALMFIGTTSFATEKKASDRKAKANTECKKSTCTKDTKDCKVKKDCPKAGSSCCNK